MSGLPLVDECNYYTEPAADGKFVGRVREFPARRTRPQARAMDARDLIVRATSEKIAELHAATDPYAGAAQPRTSGVGG